MIAPTLAPTARNAATAMAIKIQRRLKSLLGGPRRHRSLGLASGVCAGLDEAPEALSSSLWRAAATAHLVCHHADHPLREPRKRFRCYCHRHPAYSGASNQATRYPRKAPFIAASLDSTGKPGQGHMARRTGVVSTA